jgi:hypothetical protein
MVITHYLGGQDLYHIDRSDQNETCPGTSCSTRPST